MDAGGASNADWSELLASHARAHSRLFYRLAFDILRDPLAAEDVCQQAFLRAWECRASLRDAATLKAWLTRTVVNGALEAARRSSAARRALRNQAAALPAGASEPVDAMALRESVNAALARLPELAQAIVVLRVMQGMSGNEVKERLGCSSAEVSRQLHLGMDLLRGQLKDWKLDHAM